MERIGKCHRSCQRIEQYRKRLSVQAIRVVPRVADCSVYVTVPRSLIRPAASVEICIIRRTARPNCIPYSAFRSKGRCRRGVMKATMRGVSAGAFASALTLGAMITAPRVATADEGGVSFWIPGFFGSLAATPQQPGFTWATIYYHTSVSAGADVAFARQVSRGGITANFNGNLTANLDADADLGFAIPTYVFATPVLGGQAAVCPAGAVRPQYGLSGRDVDRRTGPHRLHGVRQPHRLGQRLRRFDPAVFAALESRRSQLDDLHYGRHPGRSL